MRRMALKAKRIFNCLTGRQSGQVLIMVLIMTLLGAVILTPLLSFTIGGMKQGQSNQQSTDRYYAADTGVEDAMWKIENGQLPPAMLVSPWAGSVYGQVDNYTLANSVNGETVTVQIKPVWLLTGMETPSAAQGMTASADLITAGNVISPGQFKISIIADNATSGCKVGRIGVYLPLGFTYTTGSSNLEQLANSNPAHIVPTVSNFRNGYVVIWDYAAAVNYTALPTDSSGNAIVTFNYTPASLMHGAWAWCRTNLSNPYLSWSGNLDYFQITSVATNPVTGQDTSVITYNTKDTTVGTGTAVNGDYAVTGNALLRNYNNDSLERRERAYLNSPGTISTIPGSATPEQIMLYWSGWKNYPNNVWYETNKDVTTWSSADQLKLQNLVLNYGVNVVSLQVKVGGISFVVPMVGATSWQVLPDGNPSSPNGWSYECYADITNLVTNYFSGQNVSFSGNATYTVGHADLGAPTAPTSQQLEGVWGSSATNVFNVGDSGTIVCYNGSSWSTLTSGTTSSLQAVWGSSPTDVWAVGNSYNKSGANYYTILHTVNGGASWTPTTMSAGTSSKNLYGIWGTTPSNIFAVGTGGTILKYDGTSWSALSSQTTQTLEAVWGSSDNDVWVVGDQSGSNYTILHTTDGGKSWAPTTTTTPGSSASSLYGIWGTASNNIFAVGSGGRILTYNGSFWSPMTSPTTQTLYGVWGSGSGDVFAVGASGTIVHFNGTTWSAMTSGSTQNLYGVWGSGSSNVYATGQGGTILQYNGSTWSSVVGSYPLYGWVAGIPHPFASESVVAYTNYRLGDNLPANEWAYASWSVLVIYTSPETAGHQLYLYNTFRYWDNNDDRTFTISNFLAPQDVMTDPNAARLTCFVGEGDLIYTGDNIYFGDTLPITNTALNNVDGNPTDANNVWDETNTGTPGMPVNDYEAGLDLKTFSVAYPTIKPGDTTAYVRLATGDDSWNLCYMILSFRSDLTTSGFVNYIVK